MIDDAEGPSVSCTKATTDRRLKEYEVKVSEKPFGFSYKGNTVDHVHGRTAADGKVHKGSRIIAVDGTAVDEVSFHDVYGMTELPVRLTLVGPECYDEGAAEVTAAAAAVSQF